MNDFALKLKEYLIEKYRCKTIILYGSYARGDETEESDIDVLCFKDGKKELNDTSLFKGKQLDVWVKETNEKLDPKDFLHIIDGQVIHDSNSFGEKLLKSISQIYTRGPEEIDYNQKLFLIDWMNKMYIRSTRKDAEGSYRHHWLVRDILEIYFELNNKWYEGPKKSLKWLKEHDNEMFELYNKVLKDDIASENMKLMISKLSEITKS